MRAKLNWKNRPNPTTTEREVWVAAYVVACEDAQFDTVPVRWANVAADEFVKRFGKSR